MSDTVIGTFLGALNQMLFLLGGVKAAERSSPPRLSGCDAFDSRTQDKRERVRT